MEDNFTIIHMIGLVGAGKTYFINRHFPQDAQVFDIKMVYDLHQFSPGDLHNNFEAYEKFAQALQSELKFFLIKTQQLGFNYAIIESTGTNGALNKALRSYKDYRIWIEPDKYRMDATYLRERPYAEELNKYLKKKWGKNEIYANNLYDPRFQEFDNPVPKRIAKLLVF